MASVTKPSLRTPPRHCERSEAIHLANRTVPNHGLPRRYAPRRDSIVKLAEKCAVIANSIPSLRT